MSGVSLAPDMLEALLEKILRKKGVEAAIVVSRSGMHVSGEPPEEAHLETFVAMSAIIIGAAETAAAELEEDLYTVELRTEGKLLLLLGLGKRGILVLALSLDVDQKDLISSVSKELSKMKSILS